MSKIYDRLTCCDLYDSDTDGLPDVFETAGMKLPTGEIISTKIDKPDSDDDGLLDGDEITYTINDGYVKFKLVSNPTLADSDGDGLDDPVEKEIGTYPYSIDTDGDDIDDEEEYFLGLNPIKSDTDGDCLNDGLEFFIGFDPMHKNPDGDAFNDLQEYRFNTDPYTYERTFDEEIGGFTYGLIFGDFAEDDLMTGSVVIGQIGGSFIPFVGDIRDTIANTIKGDFPMAILSGIGLVPIFGDALKSIGNISQTIVKIGDDVPTLTKYIISVADSNPSLIKFFSLNDEIVKAIKKSVTSDSITRESLERILKYADEAGIAITKTSDTFKETGKVIDGIEGVWDKAPIKRGKDIDNLLNKHSSGKGLGENFPVADRVSDGKLISTKSIDLCSKTYKDPNKLEKRLQKYIDQLNDFENKYPDVNSKEGFKWGDSEPLHASSYSSKQLELVIPDMPISDSQTKILQKFIDDYDISIIIMKG